MGFQKGMVVVMKQVAGALLLIAFFGIVQFFTNAPSAQAPRSQPFYSRDLDDDIFSEWLGDDEWADDAQPSDPPDTLQAPDGRFVIFNVLPKSGSRTLNSLALNVATRHGVDVQNTMALTNETKAEKMARLLERGKATFVYSHMSLFEIHTRRRSVVYISIVRDPIERLVSLYYYKRYGDSTAPGFFRQKMDKKNLSRDTFDECVRKNGDCVSNGQMWKTIQHFCGIPEREPHSVKLCSAKARENVKNKYLVVGVMEDYIGFIQVLERLLPDVFGGVEKFYKDFVTKKYFSVMKTKNKTGPSREVIAKLRRRMVKEYEFYDFVKQEFKKLKRKLGIS